MADQWKMAGAAWGSRAADWATITEPSNLAVYRDVFDEVELSGQDELVDVACGSGAGLREASRSTSGLAGLDAASDLVEVARERVPDADLRVGDLRSLPWDDDSFDVAVSFNGVWNVDEGVAEVSRVLRSGGRFGFSWWGPDNDLYDVMGPVMVKYAPHDHLEGVMSIGGTGSEIHELCRHRCLEPTRDGRTSTVFEFADTDMCARAWLATGPMVPLVENASYEQVHAALSEASQPLASPRTGIVRVRFSWEWTTGRRTANASPTWR